MVQNHSSAAVLRIHAMPRQGDSLRLRVYKTFLAGALKPAPSSMQLLSNCKLSPDVTSCVALLKRALARISRKDAVLVVEYRYVGASAPDYDDLCEVISLLLRRKPVRRPAAIALVVSNPEILELSVVYSKMLLPCCKSMRISLLLACDRPGVRAKVLYSGRVRFLPNLPPLLTEAPESTVAKAEMSIEEVEKGLDLIFGHFEVRFGSQQYHTPVLVSAARLGERDDFVRHVRRKLLARLPADIFSVLPTGLEGTGINRLALSIVGGNSRRLLTLQRLDEMQTKEAVCVLLTDSLVAPEATTALVERIRKAGHARILVASLIAFRDANRFEGLETLSLLTLPVVAAYEPPKGCRFCDQEVQTVAGASFDEYARALRQFDPTTFWELVRQESEFFEVKHWPSDRTPYHYYFRILAKPIFRRYSYDAAVRIRNVLESHSILPGWIKRIICPAAEEATTLSEAIGRVIGLKREDVLTIPRKVFASIAGRQIDRDTIRSLQSTFDVRLLREQNVLIVDQAAHHFRTLSAFRTICEHYDANVLACAVFLDRTHPDINLGDYVHDSHYVRLYSIPYPPRLNYECSCIAT